jgi:hypothetical protein
LTHSLKLIALDTRNIYYYFVVHMSSDRSLGEFEQIVLLAVLRLGGDAYGVTLLAEIAACTGRNPSPARSTPPCTAWKTKAW